MTSSWLLYRVADGKRVELARISAGSARQALAKYAVDRRLVGRQQGHAAYAVVGFGLIRAEKIVVPARPEELPTVDEMRAVLAGRDHNDANLISDLAVELRYRANVLGEWIPTPIKSA